MYCGAPIEWIGHKKKLYCAECKKIADKKYKEASDERKKRAQWEAENAERLAHQKDPTIWTRDYAERQKQKTLSMIGVIVK